MELSISQKFPLFGRLSKEEDIAKIDIELAILEYQQAERDLALSVELAYVECLRMQEKLSNKKEQLRLLGDMKTYVESSIKKAQASSLEYLSTRNQYDGLSIEIEQDKLNLESSILELKSILALDSLKEINLADNLELISPKEAEFSKGVLDARLDYQLIVNSQKSVKAQIALINASKFEDIEVGIFVETARSCDVPVGLKRESAIGISLSIPLPVKSYSGALTEQLAMRRQLEDLALEKEIRIKNEIRIYSLKARRLEEILKQNEDNLLKESLSAYEKYMQAYKEAQVSLAEVFSAFSEHLAVLNTNIDIRAEQAINSIKLNYALGNFENEK